VSFRLTLNKVVYQGKSEGAKPLQNLSLPLMIGIYIHIMERGIKGVRWINNPNDQL